MLNIILIGIVMLIVAGIWDADVKHLKRKTKKSTIYWVPATVLVSGIYRFIGHSMSLWLEAHNMDTCSLRDPMSPGTIITIGLFLVAIFCFAEAGKMICYARIGKSYMSRNK